LLPAVPRAEKLAAATPRDLQKALPADAAVIDFLAYTFFEQDKDRPGRAGQKYTPSYLAFVLTRDKIVRVELGPARQIEDAVRLWREAITGPGKQIPADIPARVRQLVWDKVRKELPRGVKTLFLAPDLALTVLPWAALPGERPGTILLEEYALAVVPHAPFLLDRRWPADAPAGKPPTATVLAVGGVAYDDAPAVPKAKADQQRAQHSGPAVAEGKALSWKALAWAEAEARGVVNLAAGRKLAPRLLSGKEASTHGVLAALPQARFAHLATHGFFADKEFRSVLQVDPQLFEVRGHERVGAGALSPLVLTGLVLAGANKPGTPGRGLLTGELLIDRDLSGLELTVLSACETGLGDVAGGEGVFGLQRAFHQAGARNVVATLWQVDDRATAALMAVFYRELWDKGRPPIEALRRAQLAIYRNPGKVTELAQGLRGFKVVPGSGTASPPTEARDGRAPPRLWAAFTLSGPGTLSATKD
jgi:CHAT domain-containing protein